VARFVAYFDADHAEAAFAEGARLGALDFYCDGGRLAGLEISQLPYSEIAVAPGDVEEEVAYGADAGFGGGFGGFRADASQRPQPLLQHARARPVDGGVQQGGAVELAGAGEGAGYWAARSHHQLGCPPS
jgi:hypothetical protein